MKMAGVEIEKTERFSVFSSNQVHFTPPLPWRNAPRPLPSLQETEMLQQLADHGCYVGKGLFSANLISDAIKLSKRLVQSLQESYDEVADEFSDLDMEEWDLIRHPRINPGKHNIHFCPETSSIHAALQEMAECSVLLDTLTRYQHTCINKSEVHSSGSSSGKYIVRESGLSLTAPMNEEIKAADTGFQSGMELHADGGSTEVTVLMSLEDDVSDSQGPLLVVPGSKDAYDEEHGHNPASLTRTDMLGDGSGALLDLHNCSLDHQRQTGGKCRGNKGAGEHCNDLTVYKYAYRAGKPIVMDSRTLHGALQNTSSTWRVIVWFIMEYIRI
jgi:hypothetical protein